MGKRIPILICGTAEKGVKGMLQQLRRSGHDYSELFAGSLAEFTKLVGEQKWTLVLVKAGKGWNPVTVLRRLKSERINVPVIVLTEKVNRRAGLESIRAGAEDYVGMGDKVGFLLAVERCLRGRGKASPQAFAEPARGNGADHWKLDGFFEHASIGLRWVDLAGNILHANKAELEMLGYTHEEYVGHHISEFHAVKGECEEIMTRLERKERLCNFELALRCKDGSVRHVLTDATVLDGSVGKALFFDRDITDRKGAVKGILELREQEQQRIGQDLHDGLCQQLIGIKFKLALLEKKLHEKKLAEATDATNIARVLDQAVEDTYRLVRGLQPVKLEAEGLMYALHELAASTSSLYNVSCVFRFRRPVLIHENAMAIHIYRIVQEAVSNAIKHGKATRLFIHLVPELERIVVSVKDNGIGFVRKHPGHPGMGLKIMHARARTMNGELRISARAHGGLRVTCVTPTKGSAAGKESIVWE